MVYKFILIDTTSINYKLYFVIIDNGNYKSIFHKLCLVENSLVYEIHKFLSFYKTNIAELSFIAVINGPGSYTHLRVGISVANAFGLGLDISVISINMFEAFISSAFKIDNKNKEEYLVIIDNKKEGLFCQSFDYKIKSLGRPFNLNKDEIEEYFFRTRKIIIGDGQKLLQSYNYKYKLEYFLKITKISIVDVCKSLIFKFEKEKNKKRVPVVALYIKDPKITKQQC